VILLVAPRKCSLVVVVEDATVVGPATSGTSTHEQVAGGGDLEQVTLAEQEVALLVSELAKLVVLALEVGIGD